MKGKIWFPVNIAAILMKHFNRLALLVALHYRRIRTRQEGERFFESLMRKFVVIAGKV